MNITLETLLAALIVPLLLWYINWTASRAERRAEKKEEERVKEKEALAKRCEACDGRLRSLELTSQTTITRQEMEQAFRDFRAELRGDLEGGFSRLESIIRGLTSR